MTGQRVVQVNDLAIQLLTEMVSVMNNPKELLAAAKEAAELNKISEQRKAEAKAAEDKIVLAQHETQKLEMAKAAHAADMSQAAGKIEKLKKDADDYIAKKHLEADAAVKAAAEATKAATEREMALNLREKALELRENQHFEAVQKHEKAVADLGILQKEIAASAESIRVERQKLEKQKSDLLAIMGLKA